MTDVEEFEFRPLDVLAGKDFFFFFGKAGTLQSMVIKFMWICFDCRGKTIMII